MNDYRTPEREGTASISDPLIPVPVRPAILYFKTYDGPRDCVLYRIYNRTILTGAGLSGYGSL